MVLTRRAPLLPGRSSENGVGGGSGGASVTPPSGTPGSGTSAAAMSAIVAALEGLTKEVGKVRYNRSPS